MIEERINRNYREQYSDYDVYGETLKLIESPHK